MKEILIVEKKWEITKKLSAREVFFAELYLASSFVNVGQASFDIVIINVKISKDQRLGR